MKREVFSFDVFDTVLARNVSRPKGVFTLVQERIPAVLNSDASRLSKTFQSGRIWAEFLARRRSPREDISLDNIYDVLAEWYRLDSSQRNALMDLELFIEEQVLVAIDGASDYVSWRRSQGYVVFISDMYLPHDFIKAKLRLYGLFEPGDNLYVSGEYGLTKGSGNLFSKVIEDFSINAEDLIHLGDNPVSDLAIPSQMGVRFDHSFGSPETARIHGGRWRQRGKYLLELFQSRLHILER